MSINSDYILWFFLPPVSLQVFGFRTEIIVDNVYCQKMTAVIYYATCEIFDEGRQKKYCPRRKRKVEQNDSSNRSGGYIRGDVYTYRPG